MGPEDAQGQGQREQDVQSRLPPVSLHAQHPHFRQIKQRIGDLRDHRRQENAAYVAADVGGMRKPLGNAIHEDGRCQTANIHYI